jgi:predicted permease
MKALRRLFTRFAGFVNRGSNEDRLREEVEQHIALQSEENLRAGMRPEEARRQAVLKFGAVEAVKEEYREQRGIPFIETLLQDLRYGLRTLAKSPGFAAVAILTLSLGIGANTAIFSLIDAVMLRALPVQNPSELVVLKWTAHKSPNIQGFMSSGDCPMALGSLAGANPSGCSFSEPMFRELSKTGEFSGTAAFANSGPLSLTGVGEAAMINGQLVSGDFFRTLGIKAAAGRVINANDDSPTAAPVAVLNYSYWQSAFGGSPSVIGRTIQLNAVAFTVVGVAEQRFSGITPGSDYDVWLPLSAGQRVSDDRFWDNRQDNASFWWLTVLGRLQPGVPLSRTQAIVSGIFANQMLHGSVPLFQAGGPLLGPGGLGPRPGGPVQKQMTISGALPAPLPSAPAAAVPNAPSQPSRTKAGQPAPQATSAPTTFSQPSDDPKITLVSAQAGLVGSRTIYADPLYVLMFAVGIILLIACSNVAGLTLARAAARQREMALRLALGAGRARIIRQLLTESVLLAVIGGALGVVFAIWGAHAIISFVSSNQPHPLTFAAGIDLRVLAFTIGVSLLTGILFGLAPAFRGTRVNLTPALKEGSGASAALGHAQGLRFGIGDALVVAQVALAIIVLVGAGLLVRTLQNLRRIDVGFDSHNLVIFGLDPGLAGYTDAQVDSFYRDLEVRLIATPGVRSASYSMVPLLSGAMMKTVFHWPGTPQDRASDADVLQVGPNFFRTMRIALLAGRMFNASDYQIASIDRAETAAVPRPVVVDQAFVAKYVGHDNPLGKRFGDSPAENGMPADPGYEIVGVIRDTKYSDLRSAVSPTMYVPQSGNGASFEVRTAGDPQALVPVIRRVVARMNPNLPVRDVTTESHQIDRLLFQERLVARLSTLFGLLALVLACVGLYGLLAYEVARRTREIGVRMALGAEIGDVLRLVVRQGLALALLGAILGIGVAIGATRYLGSRLYGVRPSDPVTIVAVAALLVIVALAACYVPARRATRVDPLIALRYE